MRIAVTSTSRCAGANRASLRSAFASWRSQPGRFPRPAWCHATATWTRPWKKSFSSGSAARHASSRDSCASKYSPLRISSSPSRRFSSTGRSVTLEDDVATILLAGVDLYFRGKLEASLPGHHLITADGVDPPDLVIADISRIDPDEVADMYLEVPILGFSNHTDTAGLRRANAAGFDQVVAKSALVERAPQLVDELIA